jgi:hypothetical protein
MDDYSALLSLSLSLSLFFSSLHDFKLLSTQYTIKGQSETGNIKRMWIENTAHGLSSQ